LVRLRVGSVKFWEADERGMLRITRLAKMAEAFLKIILTSCNVEFRDGTQFSCGKLSRSNISKRRRF
jgi:hypothetical protein